MPLFNEVPSYILQIFLQPSDLWYYLKMFFSVLRSSWGSMIRCVSQVTVLCLMKSIAWKVITVFGIIAQLDIFYMYDFDITNTITSTSSTTGGILLRPYTLFHKIHKRKRCIILEVPWGLSSNYTSMCIPRIRLLLSLKEDQIFLFAPKKSGSEMLMLNKINYN